jgi:GMP synthase (glutamine-hydrolysing)
LNANADSGPRILVIDGNRATTRDAQVAAGGQSTGEGYAQVLRQLAPVGCDIVRPADGDVHFSSGAALSDYDGAVITGSALNIYDGGAHIQRQIDLARALFASAIPFFGSCWGMQVAVVAAGGRVRRNPLGREFGFARRIELSAAGRQHPMFAGKPAVFEAVTVHTDDIEQLPARASVLATNELGLQAVELQVGPGTAWAVQYHPEYSYAEIAATTRRYADALLADALFGNRAELEQFVADLRLLMHDPRDRRLTWKYGLGPAMQDQRLKLAELRNWLELQVMPRYRRRL